MSPSNLCRLGLIGAVTGLVGAALGIGIPFWPEHSANDLFRYPFTTAEFSFFHVVFFLQHLGLVVLLIALSLSGAARGRSFPVGAWLAVLGMALLSIAVGGDGVSMPTSTRNAGAIGTTYGLASVVTGLGMLLAGIEIARTGRWSEWRRWTPLATGACVFVVVIPGLAGGFVIGRLAIADWMRWFAAVGWSLSTESRGATNARQSRQADSWAGRCSMRQVLPHRHVPGPTAPGRNRPHGLLTLGALRTGVVGQSAWLMFRSPGGIGAIGWVPSAHFLPAAAGIAGMGRASAPRRVLRGVRQRWLVASPLLPNCVNHQRSFSADPTAGRRRRRCLHRLDRGYALSSRSSRRQSPGLVALLLVAAQPRSPETLR
jgi:hypothetical protein